MSSVSGFSLGCPVAGVCRASIPAVNWTGRSAGSGCPCYCLKKKYLSLSPQAGVKLCHQMLLRIIDWARIWGQKVSGSVRLMTTAIFICAASCSVCRAAAAFWGKARESWASRFAALVTPSRDAPVAREVAGGNPPENHLIPLQTSGVLVFALVFSAPKYIKFLVLFSVLLRTVLGCLYVSVFVLQMARCGVLLTPLLSQGDLLCQFA